jgi:hypothetical protein
MDNKDLLDKGQEIAIPLVGDCDGSVTVKEVQTGRELDNFNGDGRGGL